MRIFHKRRRQPANRKWEAEAGELTYTMMLATYGDSIYFQARFQHYILYALSVLGVLLCVWNTFPPSTASNGSIWLTFATACSAMLAAKWAYKNRRVAFAHVVRRAVEQGEQVPLRYCKGHH